MRRSRATIRHIGVVVLAASGLWPGLGFGPGVVHAQVPLTALGLGAPTNSMDARASALGGSSMGLFGGSLSLHNPADLTAFDSTVISLSFDPESVTIETPDGEVSTSRNRLGLIQAAIPLSEKWAIGIGIRAELDQDFLIVFPDTLSTSFGEFPFEERREHDGGIGALDLSLARRFGRLTVGVGGGPIFGTLRQAASRRFEADTTGTRPPPLPVDGTAIWSYVASRLRGGVSYDVSDRLRVSGAFSWTGELEAEKQETGEVRKFNMPIEMAMGGSAQLTPSVLVAASGGWRQWSRAKFDFQDVGVASVFWGGFGVELQKLHLGASALPIRVGYRFTDLPFFPRGREQATETAFTFGFGLSASEGRAGFDFAAEIGNRGDLAKSGFEESFSRAVFTLSIRRP